MKAKCKTTKLAAVAAALLLGALGYAQAQEADTNLTTIAYWKMNQLSTNIPYSGGLTIGIADLATNVGQGTLTGSASVPAAVDDLFVWGDIQGNFNIVSDAPPGSMFNRGFDGGGGSWNAAQNLGQAGDVFYPQDQYGNEFVGPSFTEEIIFKSAVQSANKQTLIWNHQSSAYAHLQINEDGNTGDLTFWGYDGSNIQAVRMSNGTGRFDDGSWHCAVCRFDATSKIMSLYAINEDGTTVSNAIVLTSNLNSEGPGNTIIGQDETTSTWFDGEINQVRMSSVALPNSSLLCVAGGATNPHNIAYWKMNSSEVASGGSSILDLDTNVGQGVLTGSAAVPASEDDLLVEGPLVGALNFSNTVPPSSMFNSAYPYNGGSQSWNAGQFISLGAGDVVFDPSLYGNELPTPSYTEEIFFKANPTNTSAVANMKQTLIFNHHTSAYCILQINEDGPTGDLTFFSYNGTFPAIRITTSQNSGHRFDDGNWHYAACRFDVGSTNMSLYVLNQDGSYLLQSLTLGAPLVDNNNPADTFIGNDEGLATPFDGLINQVRMSDVALQDQELLALPPPPCVPAVVFTSPVSTTNYINDVATFSASAGGTTPEYQWQFNGTNIIGQTNATLTVFPVQTTNAGNYQVVVSTPCSSETATSAVASLTVIPSIAPVINIARWSMEFNDTVPNNNGVPTFNGIDDSDTNSGQGIYANGTLAASVDDLITFNAGAGGIVPVTNDVAPTSMFINGNTAGSNSFNAALLAGADGAVFFPQDQYGDEFDYQTSFSLELFFKTLGDQSSSGKMELIAQGSDAGPFRYGVDVNEAGPGFVTFAIKNGSYQVASLTNANYADGNWHYLLAKYDSLGNQLILTVANANGTASTITTALPAGFSPLFAGNTGNMFIGRYNYAWNPPVDDPRNFIGEIDEVQVTTGLLTPATGQLGLISSVVTPHITSIALSGGIVTIKFTGSSSDPASAFTLVGSSTVIGTYSALSATITSLGSGNFQATIGTSGATKFYRIKR